MRGFRGIGHQLLTTDAFGQKLLTCSMQQDFQERMAVMPFSPADL
jgi:hypothetical protein